MFKFTDFIFTLVFVLAISITALAQGPPPPPTGSPGFKTPGGTFTSLEGGFKIEIPDRVMGYKGLRPNEVNSLGAGGLYLFRQPEASYRIGYVQVNPKLKPAEVKEKVRGFHKNILKFPLQDMKINEKVSDGKTVIDVRGETFNKYHFRYILKDDKIIVLIAEFSPRDENQETSIAKAGKVFDSLELISAEKIIAQKLLKAISDPLPQMPAIKRKLSDAQEEEIKGRVKMVVEYSEDLTGNSYSVGKKKNSEMYFDEQGNIVKTINYNSSGLPASIRTFGYIDGKRVSKYSSISYASNPPPPALPPGAVKKKDKRYSSSYEYAYDDKNRLVEKNVYNNTGELSYRVKFEYTDKKITRSSFSPAGKLRRKSVNEYDDKGNLIKSTSISTTPEYPDSFYNYSYKEFDENGNWTKKLVTTKIGLYGGKYREGSHIRYREITYYR